jgi:hypothetical protein
MGLGGAWALPVAWLSLGLTIVVCGAASRRSRAAWRIGIGAVSLLWVVAGAGANLFLLVTGNTYTGFADGAWLSFVHDTWESLVVPHHHVFIGILIAGEALFGLFVLVPGQVRQVSLIALSTFTVLLVAFGWGFLLWSGPMAVSLELLRRSDRSWSPPPHGSGRAAPAVSTR